MLIEGEKMESCGLLKDKVAVITGAGSGIGKASVDLFTKNGAKVIAADIKFDLVEALKTEFADRAELIFPIKVNVADRAEVEAMIDFAVEKCGKLDILFNNAGIMDGMMPVAEVEDDFWNRVMSVNTNSVMYACRKAVRYFMEKEIKGNIINTASLGGLQGGRAGFAYTASKHAVVGMTKNIAFMYSDTGIRCNAICPGAVMTNIGLGSNAPSPRGAQKMQAGMPLCTSFADPYQLANIALFLASENSSFINGAAITADGGWSSY